MPIAQTAALVQLERIKPMYYNLLGAKPGGRLYRQAEHFVRHKGLKFLVDRYKGMFLALTGRLAPSEVVRTNPDGSFRGPERFLYRRALGDKYTRSGKIRVFRFLKLVSNFLASEPDAEAYHKAQVELCEAPLADELPLDRIHLRGLRPRKQFYRKPLEAGTELLWLFPSKPELYMSMRVCYSSARYLGWLANYHSELFSACLPFWMKVPEEPVMGVPVVGRKVGLVKDGGLKTRYIYSPLGIVNAVLRRTLEPILEGITQKIPQMYHMDQEAGKIAVTEMLQKWGACTSIDLEQATDHFPLDYQLRVLAELGVDDRIIRFTQDMCQSYWLTPHKQLSWLPQGQPMGLRGSFLLFSLGLWAYVKTLGVEDFVLVGDDLVVGGPLSLQKKVLASFRAHGLKISMNKSFILSSWAEFCSRLINEQGVLPVEKGKVTIFTLSMYQKFADIIFNLKQFYKLHAVKYLPKPLGLGNPESLRRLPIWALRELSAYYTELQRPKRLGQDRYYQIPQMGIAMLLQVRTAFAVMVEQYGLDQALQLASSDTRVGVGFLVETDTVSNPITLAADMRVLPNGDWDPLLKNIYERVGRRPLKVVRQSVISRKKVIVLGAYAHRQEVIIRRFAKLFRRFFPDPTVQLHRRLVGVVRDEDQDNSHTST